MENGNNAAGFQDQPDAAASIEDLGLIEATRRGNP